MSQVEKRENLAFVNLELHYNMIHCLAFFQGRGRGKGYRYRRRENVYLNLQLESHKHIFPYSKYKNET